jgi:cyclopropane-fatty-acyl-phospholipid synthase
MRTVARSEPSALGRWLAGKLRSTAGAAPVRFVLWDGSEIAPTAVAPSATVRVNRCSGVGKLLVDPELWFGDGYSQGWIEVEGDLVSTLVFLYQATNLGSLTQKTAGLLARWLSFRQRNTPGGSQRNIHHHYDLDTDFFKLWLDSQLVYTCAYFPSPDSSLEDAQVAKMDHVCRKVLLRPGDRVVEAGCGWGALALHMARRYGARVRAFNISHEQIDYARKRARREGLDDMVEFVEDDYRNISGKCDVFLSVGMLEHVGRGHYKDLSGVVHRCLSEEGRGLLHFIGRNHNSPLSAWIRNRVFPGAYPPSLREAMDVFQTWDFAVLDAENLRQHYARTLMHWLSRYEDSFSRICASHGQEFARMWRLYLAGSAAAFLAGSLQLFQITFARAANNELPWTRDHLYQAAGGRPGREAPWKAAMP